MLSATFDDRGGRAGANYLAFSVDLTRSRAIFRDPEILYIIRRTCCTSQGEPDSSFPCGQQRLEISAFQVNPLRNLLQIVAQRPFLEQFGLPPVWDSSNWNLLAGKCFHTEKYFSLFSCLCCYQNTS